MNPDEDGLEWGNVFYSNSDDTTVIDIADIDTTFDITSMSPTFTLDEPSTEIEIQQSNGETLKVAATICQQKYEIEALTDIIKEMVKTKNFDVELDIEKRVEQKKFLKRLGED